MSTPNSIWFVIIVVNVVKFDLSVINCMVDNFITKTFILGGMRSLICILDKFGVPMWSILLVLTSRSVLVKVGILIVVSLDT